MYDIKYLLSLLHDGRLYASSWSVFEFDFGTKDLLKMPKIKKYGKKSKGLSITSFSQTLMKAFAKARQKRLVSLFSILICGYSFSCEPNLVCNE
jgi:hypothetical protein